MPLVILTSHNEPLPPPDALHTLQLNYVWRQHVAQAMQEYFDRGIDKDFENTDNLATYNNFIAMLLDFYDEP